MTAALLIEICAAAAGVVGTWLLARNGTRAGWGFVAYLASNAGWILFARIHGHHGLLVQQLVFTVMSLYGIWNWLVLPHLDRLVDQLLDAGPWDHPSL